MVVLVSKPEITMFLTEVKDKKKHYLIMTILICDNDLDSVMNTNFKKPHCSMYYLMQLMF